MSNKLILTIAPTGNVPTREMNPNVPLTPQEIAAQIYECWKAGSGGMPYSHPRQTRHPDLGR